MSIVQDRDGCLFVQNTDSGENKDTEKTQKVLSLSMRALKEYLGGIKNSAASGTGEEDHVSLHREDELYAAADAHEQASLLDKRKSLSKQKSSQDDKDGQPKKKQVKKG